MEQLQEPPMSDNPDSEHGEQSHIFWHSAFVKAMQLELYDYRGDLEYHSEHQLTAEPLKIDCVIIKKPKGVVIKKNIATIFREVNILEYKSPGDYVSVADFYKVYGYACLYASFEKVPINNITVTFVESRYPREVLIHLKVTRGYTVEETGPGIYTISGDVLPIQIIDNRKLSIDENIWLKDLDNGLEVTELQQVLYEILKKPKDARVEAYLDVIAKANFQTLEEVINMSSPAKSLEEVLERTGMTARLEARAEARVEARVTAKIEERKTIDIAKNMINLGFSPDSVVSATNLTPEKVKEIIESKDP